MIQANDFRRLWAEVESAAAEVFREVGASGWYILGKEVADFEQALARYWGFASCVGVASGLDAIEIALRALGCRAGDRVVTTPLSAFATTLAIVKVGAMPVFVDIDEHGLIDLDECRRALAKRARFVVPVHLYGHSLDLERLRALRAEFGCRMVEDCAQSIGATWKGQATGSAGDAAATSFYPTKNLGAFGDGGALLTQDGGLARTARALRDYGQTAKYRHDLLGSNSRLDELHAALLHRVLLGRLPAWTRRREGIAGFYANRIRNPKVRVPGAPPGSASCWHLFPVLVDDKTAFLGHLRANGVAGGEHYPLLIPEQRAMEGCAWESEGSLGRAREWSRREVSLPIHPFLTDEEAARVADACNLY
ncbi:MAG: DegT/DnrJ/EryC1/StrS family aminotransferase [Bryobacteraceae bacterium]